VNQKAIHVGCPCCNNKRLFDLSPDTKGEMEIKCPWCGKVISISVQNEEVYAEQMMFKAIS